MKDIYIRIATLEDLPTLLEFEQGVILAERPFSPTLRTGHINYYDIQALIRSDNSEVFVALIDKEIVSSGYVRIEKAKPYVQHDFYAYLGFMYVKPTFRGKGVNQKVIEALKRWAKSREVYEIRLDVYEENIPAIKAYEKAGFKKHLVEMRMKIEK